MDIDSCDVCNVLHSREVTNSNEQNRHCKPDERNVKVIRRTFLQLFNTEICQQCNRSICDSIQLFIMSSTTAMNEESKCKREREQCKTLLR